jgi:methyl-accepting chemotaxis protein
MKDLRIAMKLGLAFGLMVFLLIALSIAARAGLAKVGDSQHEVLNDRYPKIELATGILDELSMQARLIRNLVIMDNPKDRQEQLDQLASSRAKASDQYEKLAAAINSPKSKALLEEALAARKAYQKVLEEYLVMVKAGDPKLKDKLLGDVRPALMAYEGKLRALIAFQKDLMTKAGRQAEDATSTANAVILGAALFGCMLAMLAAVVVTRGVTRPVQLVVQALHAFSKGDLTGQVHVDRKDEIGQLQQALHQLRDSLGGTVNTVRQNAESVATASAQIAQGNQDLSHRTEEQASALEETAATMEQLGSTVRTNADSAKQANQLAQNAARVATQGGEVVGQVVNTMEGISESSRKIGDIIGVIDGIAFQTNILALNAAVEAARAGEQGRGFAVVAGEVRTLAQRSAEAAKEIKALISRNVDQVTQGTTLVDQAGKTMEEIVGSIQRVSDIVSEITAATIEQSNGVQQVGDAVGQMDQVTQQNAALVEESAAAAGSLKEQAQQLVDAVAFFKLAGTV